jgi:hypothetical protein
MIWLIFAVFHADMLAAGIVFWIHWTLTLCFMIYIGKADTFSAFYFVI